MKQLFLASFVFLFSLYAFSADDAANAEKENKPAKSLSLSDVTNFLASDTNKDKKTEKDSNTISGTAQQKKNAFGLLNRNLTGDIAPIFKDAGDGKWDNAAVNNLMVNNQPQLSAFLKISEYEYCAGPPVRTADDEMPYLVAWRNYARVGVLTAEYHLRNKQHQKGIDYMDASLDFGIKVLKPSNALITYLVGTAIADTNAAAIERFYNAKLISDAEKKELAKKLPSRNDYAIGYSSMLPGERRSFVSIIEGIRKNDKDVLDMLTSEDIDFPKEDIATIKTMKKEDVAEMMKFYDVSQKTILDCIKNGKEFHQDTSSLSKGQKIISDTLIMAPLKSLPKVEKSLERKKQLLK